MDFFPLREAEGEIRRDEFGVEGFHSTGVRQKVIPHCAENNTGGVGAGDDVGKGPRCWSPKAKARVKCDWS